MLQQIIGRIASHYYHPCRISLTLSGVTIMSEDPTARLHDLITRYTVITGLPAIGSYRRISGAKPGHCIFRGCSEPIAWEDGRGQNYLCEGHYLLVKQWTEEARKGLIPGQPAAIFSKDPEKHSRS
jgi:hypothetical protein